MGSTTSIRRSNTSFKFSFILLKLNLSIQQSDFKIVSYIITHLLHNQLKLKKPLTYLNIKTQLEMMADDTNTKREDNCMLLVSKGDEVNKFFASSLGRYEKVLGMTLEYKPVWKHETNERYLYEFGSLGGDGHPAQAYRRR